MPLQRLYTGPAGYTMNDYQEDAYRSAAHDLPSDILLAVLALGVSGEAGEVAEHIKKYLGHGHHLDREVVKAELGDVLWYIANMARYMGLTLGEVAAFNTEKLKARYPDGFSTERSLNR